MFSQKFPRWDGWHGHSRFPWRLCGGCLQASWVAGPGMCPEQMTWCTCGGLPAGSVLRVRLPPLFNPTVDLGDPICAAAEHYREWQFPGNHLYGNHETRILREGKAKKSQMLSRKLWSCRQLHGEGEWADDGPAPHLGALSTPPEARASCLKPGLCTVVSEAPSSGGGDQ